MEQKPGYIYILTNPSFPDYVKLGYADDVKSRLKQLNRSESTPFAFRCYATYKVNHRLSDLKLHTIIDKLDPTLRSIDTVDGKKRIREFYAMSAEDAYALLEAIAQINGLEENLKLWDMTKDEIKQKNLSEEINSEKKDRLSNFRFSYCNLKEGDVISSLENPEIKATIIDNNHITYNGMTYTLSGLAKEITNAKTIAGPRHFTYEGKILSEIREKIEKEKC